MCLKLGRCLGNPGSQRPRGGVWCGEPASCRAPWPQGPGARGGVWEKLRVRACAVAVGVECTALVVVACGERERCAKGLVQ